jgi:hypothetical protein
MDGGSWFLWNNIGPNSSWAWEQCQAYNLSAGNHTLTIAYREDGSQLDKLYLSNSGTTPSGEGSAADNCSVSSGNSVTVRAMGTNGSEQITLAVGGTEVQSWTLSTSMSNYTANTSLTGNITVEFTNDDGENRDVQVDYIQVDGTTLQAENQSNNTGVWQDGSCGGQNSEWLHCNGYIEFSALKSVTSVSHSTNREMVVYPNPAHDVLKVSLPELTNKTVLSIYSSNGSLVKEVTISKGENDINLTDLGSGLYILKVKYGSELITSKFLKK